MNYIPAGRDLFWWAIRQKDFAGNQYSKWLTQT